MIGYLFEVYRFVIEIYHNVTMIQVSSQSIVYRFWNSNKQELHKNGASLPPSLGQNEREKDNKPHNPLKCWLPAFCPKQAF